MGSDNGRPGTADYNPALEFCLRTQAEGGSVRSPATFRGDPAAQGRRECVILIHGFNNSDGASAEAFMFFRNAQTGYYVPGAHDAFNALFADTFWPGDAKWGWLDAVDFLVYPHAVHAAVRTADELATLLSRMPNLQRVSFVTHSLGARVAFETIALLRQRTSVHVDRIVLMAAAIPSEMLEAGGQFSGLMADLSREGSQILVLYSHHDNVLFYTFPPGQAAAGRSERSDRALGWVGPTVAMPGFSRTLYGAQMSGGHGDYWGDPKSAGARDATRAAGQFLQLGSAVRDVGTVRNISSPSGEQSLRALGVIRKVGE